MQVPLDGHSVLYVNLDRETLLIAGVGEAFAGGVPAILNEDPKMVVPCTVTVLPAGNGLSGKSVRSSQSCLRCQVLPPGQTG